MPPTAQNVPEIDSTSQGVKILAAQKRPAIIAMWSITIALIVGIFCCVYFLLGDHAIVSLTENDGSILGLVVPLLIPLFGYFALEEQARRQMLAQIAASLGLTYQKDGSFEGIFGALFSRGHGKSIYDILAGTYRGYALRMFSYQYTVQEGRTDQLIQNSVCELTYSAPLPHIVLLRHAGRSDVGFFSGLGKLQKTQLEGNFGTYFDLYVEPGAEIKVREIFQPDVMQDFIERFANHDLEITGSKIYLLQAKIPSTRAGYLAFYALADFLTDKLLPGLRTAAAEPPPTSDVSR